MVRMLRRLKFFLLGLKFLLKYRKIKEGMMYGMPQIDPQTRAMMGQVTVDVAVMPDQGRIMVRVKHEEKDKLTEALANVFAQSCQLMGMKVTLYKD